MTGLTFATDFPTTANAVKVSKLRLFVAVAFVTKWDARGERGIAWLT